MKNTLLVSLLLLSLLILPVNAQCVAPPAGLVSWWPGDGNALDIAGLIQLPVAQLQHEWRTAHAQQIGL